MKSAGLIEQRKQKTEVSDMYPLYWTKSKEGIIMRYSYAYKRACVALYRQGKWAECPEGITEKRFHATVREWARLEDLHGPEALKHKPTNKVRSPDEKYAFVAEVCAGKSIRSVALDAGISSGQLCHWVHKYKIFGYDGLIDKKKGRKSKEPHMKKQNINNPRPLNESEYEELIRLRAENKYIKAENAVIKKEIALREEREAAQRKAKKQRSSKNSENKDMT